jgi:putative thioredoxin
MPAAPDTVVVESADEFEAVRRSEPLVVAYVHAGWCQPCETLTPRVERVAADAGATLATIDADANMDWTSSLGVHSVPVVQVYVDGSRAGESHGLVEEHVLRDLVDDATNG